MKRQKGPKRSQEIAQIADADLIPFMEFAHNAHVHGATGHSPFEVWYGYQPEFIPPLNFATTIPTVEERLKSMDRIRNEVTAALKLAAETMTRTGPEQPSRTFKEGDLVWLEGTNIHTTHPKAKLAPRRHGPFKVMYSTTTNSKLTLPKSWRIHPVFHNSLLLPYNKNLTHGPNFPRPPPDIVDGEDEHYEVETILQSRLSPNQRGIQYFVKWKGYPDLENSWLSATAMKHAQDLVHTFHASHPHATRPTGLKSLQAQQEHKEGILLRSVTTKGNPLYSHGHEGVRPIGEEAYKILYPLGRRPTPSGCTGTSGKYECT